MNLEQFGLFGGFLGGAIPWLEASPIHKVSKKSLWKTAIKDSQLLLSLPDVRHKRILDQAPEQGDSAASV